MLLKEGRFWRPSLLLLCQQQVELGLVETYHHLITHHYDRHAHLARFLNHFLGFFVIAAHIIFREIYLLARKILFRPEAPGSGLS
jgi:hypothetical protein